MHRLTIPALLLSLTALVAWGCGSSGQSANPTLPNGSPDIDSPGLTIPDAEDDDSLAPRNPNIGGEDEPPFIRSEDPSGHGSPDSSSTSRDAVTPKRNCDGQLVMVNPESKFRVFLSETGTASATNIDEPIALNFPESGMTGEATIERATWNLTPTGGDFGTWTFAAVGTSQLDGSELPTPYSVNYTFGYYQNATCTVLTHVMINHQGPGGLVSNIYAFAGGLRLTSNGYVPVEGERYGAETTTAVGSNPGTWVAEVIETNGGLGNQTTTFDIGPAAAEGGAHYQFTWHNEWGVVGITDPYLTGDNAFEFQFPGAPR